MATIINTENVAKVYVATFNRAPDKDGLDYWTYSSGLTSLEEIAQSFFDQSETQLIYTPSMTIPQKVTLAYQYLFNRAPDTDGLAYWVNEINRGSITQSAMLIALINGAQNSDATIISNKTLAGLYFADHNLNNITEAYNAISNVTADINTVIQSYHYIDALMAEPNASLLDNALILSQAITGIGSLANNLTYGVSSLDSGNKWDTQIVTYSANLSMPTLYTSSYYIDDCSPGWTALNTAQKAVVRTIMSEVASLVDISFVEVANNEGQIRFNVVDTSYGGFAYYPGGSAIGGDIFLTSAINSDPSTYGMSSGEQGWATIVHELGHALGLKHPFEDGIILPLSDDNIFHSIMSYTNGKSLFPVLDIVNNLAHISYEWLNPKLYSLYDVATLQSIYGANLTTNLGNTTYSVDSIHGDIITIWDAGGVDTIELSNTIGKSIIDLSPGTLNSGGLITIEERIVLLQEQAHAADFYNDTWLYDALMAYESEIYTGENNLGIATGAIIENLITGDGNDIIRDNLVDNQISTGAGDDTIYLGSGGFDTVDGGLGIDTIYLDTAFNTLLHEKLSENIYRIIGNDFAFDIAQVEYIICSDDIARDMTFFI